METSYRWYAITHPNRATHYPLYTSLCTGELNATPKHKCFLKGVSLGHVGRNSNVKNLKDLSSAGVWRMAVLGRASAGAVAGRISRALPKRELIRINCDCIPVHGFTLIW